MKKINLLTRTLLLFALIVGSTSVWAQTYTTTFTRESSKLKCTGDVTYTTTKEPGSKDDARGAQFGTSGTPAGEFTLTAGSSISSISKIVVSCCTAKSGSATVTIKVGGTQLGTTKTIEPNTSSADDYEFSGTALSGIITIDVNATSKAFYLKSVAITCVVPAAFAAGKSMISFSNADKALDLTTANLPSGLAAYKATAADASSVTLTAVNSTVAKNTGIILTGTAGTTYNIPVVGTGTDISASNLLVASNGTSTVTDAYVLSDGKFHPVAGGGLVIPAGKAYLPAGSISAHELDITFDNGDVTGIADVRAKMEDFKGEFFNLSGQRVAQPTKGLYIVNGKKVIIK